MEDLDALYLYSFHAKFIMMMCALLRLLPTATAQNRKNSRITEIGVVYDFAVHNLGFSIVSNQKYSSENVYWVCGKS